MENIPAPWLGCPGFGSWPEDRQFWQILLWFSPVRLANSGIVQVRAWFFFYSYCFHLEHRASVKRFVSLQFLNLRQSVGLLGRGISPSQGRYLTQIQNKHRQTSIPWVGFEPTIPVFERAKTSHALDHAATVIGRAWLVPSIIFQFLIRQSSC
jgi:hypothetical protein